MHVVPLYLQREASLEESVQYFRHACRIVTGLRMAYVVTHYAYTPLRAWTSAILPVSVSPTLLAGSDGHL